MQNNKSNSQAFNLNWNKFPFNLVSAFNDFKNNLDFVDVTLACDGKLLSAHKLLLASCSAFFRDLLKSNPCRHPVVILPAEVRFVDLEKMLQFIYEGKVNIPEENLVNFLKTAELFKITGFEDHQPTPKLQKASAIVSGDNQGAINTLNPLCPRLPINSKAKTLTSHLSNPSSKCEKLTGLNELKTVLKQEISAVNNEEDFQKNFPVSSFTSNDSPALNNSSQTQMKIPEVTPSCSVVPFIKDENDCSFSADCSRNIDISFSNSVLKDKDSSGHIVGSCDSFFSKYETNNYPYSSSSFYESSTDYEENPNQEIGTRKRKCINLQLNRNAAKLARNFGLEYVSASKSKRVVKARQMGDPCKDNCKLKCASRVTTESRELIFEHYWALGDTQIQREFLSSCMVPIKPKYQYPRNENKRRDNNAFNFEINGERFRVCKMFFKSTLGINDRPIRTVIAKRNEMGMVSGDLRGKHGKHVKLGSNIKRLLCTQMAKD